MVQKGALIVCLVLALTQFDSISGCNCLDYGNKLCTIVSSSRGGTIGHGRSCSDGATALIVNVNGNTEMYHCKGGHPAAVLQGSVPEPPPPSAAVATNKDSELAARILSALGLQNEKVTAQGCNSGGGRLCLYIRAWNQEQWYCSDQPDVYGLGVEFQGQKIKSCS